MKLENAGFPTPDFDDYAQLRDAFRPVGMDGITQMHLSTSARSIALPEPRSDGVHPPAVKPFGLPGLRSLILEGVPITTKTFDLLRCPDLEDLYACVYLDQDGGVAREDLNTLLSLLTSNGPELKKLVSMSVEFMEPKYVRELGQIAGRDSWEWGDVDTAWKPLEDICFKRRVDLDFPKCLS